MADALVIPMMLAITISNRARIRTIEGQSISHFVYGSASGFWQHLEGQQLGQQQQQHRHIQITKLMRRPRTKGPMKNPNSVYIGWTCSKAALILSSLLTIVPRS
jgi:hypothetical protein